MLQRPPVEGMPVYKTSESESESDSKDTIPKNIIPIPNPNKDINKNEHLSPLTPKEKSLKIKSLKREIQSSKI